MAAAPFIYVALGQAALGDLAQAFGALEEAFTRREVALVALWVDPLFEPLLRGPAIRRPRAPDRGGRGCRRCTAVRRPFRDVR